MIRLVLPRFCSGRVMAMGLAVASVLWSAPAAPLTVFSGIDAGVNPADPRPNSDAAAASFDAAAAGLGPAAVIDFEAAPLGDFLSLTSAQLGVPGVAITPAAASDGNDTAITTGGSRLQGFNVTPGGQNYLEIDENAAGDPSVGVTFVFDVSISAFGGYFTGVGNSPGVATVVFDNGTVQSFGLTGAPNGGSQFFGFTDTTGSIAQVSVITVPVAGANNERIGVDDVRFVVVPEPAVLLPAVALTGLLRRRRPRR